MLRRIAVTFLAVCALGAGNDASALETVTTDNFAGANGTPPDPSKWRASTPGVFLVQENALQGLVQSNGTDATLQLLQTDIQDAVIEFDLQRFTSAGEHFSLALRPQGGIHTRIRFAAAGEATDRIVASVLPLNPAGVTAALGQSAPLATNEWVTFRLRINERKVQLFAKAPTARQYSLLGELVSTPADYISSGRGAVQLMLPALPGPTAGSNRLKLDNFRLRQADRDKKVFADFHGARYTRAHDGKLGNWKQELQSPQSPFYVANYNADLIDANGAHQLAAPGMPTVGMQSVLDRDYVEYHVLLAKMAGIDGFIVEYGCPCGQINQELQLLQSVAAEHDFQIGINWLDDFYFDYIHTNADYQSWASRNGRDPSSNQSKRDYIPQVWQQLINLVYDQPNGAKIGGKPLLLLFQGSPLSAADLAALKSQNYTYGGAAAVRSPFLIPRRAPIGLAGTDPGIPRFWSDPAGWETHSDGTFGWIPLLERPVVSPIYQTQGELRDAREYARAHVAGMLLASNDEVNIAGVAPGFDNKYCAAWGAHSVRLLDRHDGRTFVEMWEQYLEDRDVIDSVLIVSWNDHTEAHGIEPLNTYGVRELRTAARYSARFKGRTDTSAALDFEIPVELFKLRKAIDFLRQVGASVALLDTYSAALDLAARDIAAGNHATATARIAGLRTLLETARSRNVRTTTRSFDFFNAGAVTVAPGTDQRIDIPDEFADFARARHFEGNVDFEYLDNSSFAANKTLYISSFPPGPPELWWRDVQMQLRHGNGDGQWKSARISLNKHSMRLNHHLTPGADRRDLYFSALGGPSNGGVIRNAKVTLAVHEYVRSADDEPTVSRFFLPPAGPSQASCPAGYFTAIVDDGPAAGLTAGAFGMEVLLDDPGTRQLQGGLNFGGLVDVAQVGFAGANIANSGNENQLLNISLTGNPANDRNGTLQVRVMINRRSASSSTAVFDQTLGIRQAAAFRTSLEVAPGFYEALVAPVGFPESAAGGEPEGEFFFSLTTSFVNRPGGGFQGGAVVGGYHARNPAGGVSGFAGFCLSTPHSATIRVLSQPSYGPTGARDLRLRVLDDAGRSAFEVPMP